MISNRFSASVSIHWLTSLIAVSIFVGSIVGILVERGLGLSFSSYYDTARRILSHEYGNLYFANTLIAGQPPLGGTTFTAMPIIGYVIAPLGLFDPHTALIILKIVNTLSIWLALLIIYLHLEKHTIMDAQQRHQFLIKFLISAVLFQSFWTIFRIGGSLAPFVFLLYVIGLVQHTRSNYMASACCVVCAALIYPEYIIAAVLPFAFSPARFRYWFILVSVLAVSVSFMICGIKVHVDLFARLLYEARHLELPYLGSNLVTWVEPLMLKYEDYRLLYTPYDVAITLLLVRLFIVLLLVRAVINVQNSNAGHEMKQQFCFMVAILLAPVLSFTTFSEQLVSFFIAYAFILAQSAKFPKIAIVLAWSGLVFALFQNSILVRMYIKVFGENDWHDLMVLGAAKSVTMLAVVLIIILWPRRFTEAYR